MPPAVEALGNRLLEYQRAAVNARKRGEMDEALHWLRRSKELASACEALLNDFPSAEDQPWVATPDGGAVAAKSEREQQPDVSEPSPAAVTVDVADEDEAELSDDDAEEEAAHAAYMAQANAAMAAASAVASSPPPQQPPAKQETAAAAEDDDDDDGPFSHIVSLKVLDYEAERLGSSDTDITIELSRRRTILLALERQRRADPDGSTESMASYAKRLEAAVLAEKARSRDAKQAGQTKEALHALKRAKVMLDELEGPDSPIKQQRGGAAGCS